MAGQNPLADVLSSEERQVVIALFNAEHNRLGAASYSKLMSAEHRARMNKLTTVAHKLGLNLDA